MKIVVISNVFPPFVMGGYEIRCEQVSLALARLGHEVVVLTSTHGVKEPVAETSTIRIHRRLRLYLPFSNTKTFETIPFRLNRIARWKITQSNRTIAHNILNEERPDIVFAWSQARLGLGAIRTVQQLRIPLAWSFGDTNIAQYKPARIRQKDPRQLFNYVLDHFLASSATWKGINFTKTHFVSNYIKQELIRLELPVEGGRVIYRGIPLSQFPVRQEKGFLHHPVRVLYVGQVNFVKGVHTAIKACQILAERHGSQYVSLTVVGEGVGEHKVRLSEMAKRGDAEVIFRNKVSHDEIAAVYRDHDIFVCPSTPLQKEGFAGTPIEAMASGLPVVGTRQGGLAELFSHENNALVVESEDAKGLSCQIERLIVDEDLRGKLIDEARHQVERDFDLDRYAHDMESFLVDALAQEPNK